VSAPVQPQQLPPASAPGPSADTAGAIAGLIAAAEILARKARMTESMAEAKDALQGALFAAQAVAVFDPNKSQTGVPLDHELAVQHAQHAGAVRLAETQAAGQLLVEQQRGQNAAEAAKAAPSPARRVVTTQRDEHGRATSHTLTEG
jgi:hypothetical protein